MIVISSRFFVECPRPLTLVVVLIPGYCYCLSILFDVLRPRSRSHSYCIFLCVVSLGHVYFCCLGSYYALAPRGGMIVHHSSDARGVWHTYIDWQLFSALYVDWPCSLTLIVLLIPGCCYCLSIWFGFLRPRSGTHSYCMLFMCSISETRVLLLSGLLAGHWPLGLAGFSPSFLLHVESGIHTLIGISSRHCLSSGHVHLRL